MTKIISLTILNLVTLNVGAKRELLFTDPPQDVKQTGLIRWFVKRKVELSCSLAVSEVITINVINLVTLSDMTFDTPKAAAHTCVRLKNGLLNI